MLQSFCRHSFCLPSFCLPSFCLHSFYLPSFCLHSFCLHSFCLAVFKMTVLSWCHEPSPNQNFHFWSGMFLYLCFGVLHKSGQSTEWTEQLWTLSCWQEQCFKFLFKKKSQILQTCWHRYKISCRRKAPVIQNAKQQQSSESCKYHQTATLSTNKMIIIQLPILKQVELPILKQVGI